MVILQQIAVKYLIEEEMWNIFKYKNSNHAQSSRERYEEITDRSLQELRAQFYEKLKQITRQIAHSESLFTPSYLVDVKEETLTSTFQEMMASLEGLISIIGQLKIEYDQLQNQLNEYRQMKDMIMNHTAIIDSIQQTHSKQVAQIYQQRSDNQRLYRQKIEAISQEKRFLQQNAQSLQQQLKNCREEIGRLKLQNEIINHQKKQVQISLLETTLKYNQFVNEGKEIQLKKVVDFQNIKLDYVFYYSRLREKIVGYLSIRDILSLELVNKFYRYTFRKEKPKHIFLNLHRTISIMQREELKSAKYYDRIYDMFPLQNIKVCAFKYLYFKIKPATYILPYLQEQQVQIIKVENEPKQQKQQISNNRFNWKQFFTSDKTSTKGDKRQDNKFSLAQLKSQQQYKRLQNRLELTFKYIFPIKMPYDLTYFSDTMEKQLQELKSVMSEYKGVKMGQIEWTSQLHCLTKYMYLQITEIYNLLQVVFGDLVSKNKQLINLRQNYEYLKQNEIVLRNLIENISNDKSSIEKKYMMVQNQILKQKLQRQVMSNKYDLLLSEYQQVKKEFGLISQQYSIFMKTMEKWQEERRVSEINLNLVREQLENLQNYSGKERRGSFASVGSEEHGLERQAISS